MWKKVRNVICPNCKSREVEYDVEEFVDHDNLVFHCRTCNEQFTREEAKSTRT